MSASYIDPKALDIDPRERARRQPRGAADPLSENVVGSTVFFLVECLAYALAALTALGLFVAFS
jgi:hypothetical protein